MMPENEQAGRMRGSGRNKIIFVALIAIVAGLFVLPPSLFDSWAEDAVIAPRREAPVTRMSTGRVAVTRTEFSLPAPLTRDAPQDAEHRAVRYRVSYPASPVPGFDPLPSGPLEACATTLEVAAGIDALISIALRSPCEPGGVFTIEMDGLQVPLRANAAGSGEVALPALSARPQVRAMLRNRVVAEVAGPEVALDRVDRIIALWPGALPGLQLHVLVDGARTGDPGHVWVASTPDAGTAEADAYGYHMYAAPSSRKGEVLASYTLPSGARVGGVRAQAFAAVPAGAGLCRPGRPVPRLILVDGGKVSFYDLDLSRAVCNPITRTMPSRFVVVPILTNGSLIPQAVLLPES